MALCTSIEHADGTTGLTPDASGGKVGWSMWHCMRLSEAMKAEIGLVNWDETKSVFPDEYVFKLDHEFEAPETDIWDRGGEPGVTYKLIIKAGDTYKCWYSR